MLALLQFPVVLDFMIISPLGDILLKDMNITTGQFGTVVSAYAFSAGISGFLSAGIADRFDRKHLLLFFYSGFIIGTICCGLANSYSILLASRIVTGIFGGVIGSISMAIITDIFHISQRGRVMGMVQMAFAVSQIIGIPAGLFLAGKYNWHATFFMIVLLAALIFVLILFRMQPIRSHLEIQKGQLAGGVAALFAGLVVHQESKHSPIEHFDTLGYIMVGIVFLCFFLLRRVDRLVHPYKKGW